MSSFSETEARAVRRASSRSLVSLPRAFALVICSLRLSIFSSAAFRSLTAVSICWSASARCCWISSERDDRLPARSVAASTTRYFRLSLSGVTARSAKAVSKAVTRAAIESSESVLPKALDTDSR